MKGSLRPALAVVAVCAMAGCVSQINACARWVEQCWTAESAWHSRKWMYEDVDCSSSFKAGFKAGYKFAICGGDSCQPPGPSHFWCSGGMTDEDQREARAWCDGFTHGTLAAQQDGSARASALDAQTAMPPENVPEVYYYQNSGTAGSIGSSQAAVPFGGQYPLDPAAQVPVPMAPADTEYPPSAPPATAAENAPSQKPGPYRRYQGSSAFPGIGSLRTPVDPLSLDRRATETPQLDHGMTPPPAPGAVPPAPARVVQNAPVPPVSSSAAVSKQLPEAAPSTLPTPSIRSAPTSQWELPIIRN